MPTRVPDEKLALAFHTSPNGFAITTLAEGRYIECNDSECRLTGYRRDEIIGRTSKELNFWVDHAERLALCRLLNEQGVVYNFDFRFRRNSGDLRFGLFSAALITYDEQPCILGEILDVTDKKEAEEALRQSREELEERVLQRTQQLEALNESLRREIFKRRQAEKALKRRERDLQRKTAELEDTNTALNVLLKRTSQDQILHEEKLAYNLRQFVWPHFEKIQKTKLPANCSLTVSALGKALTDIFSPFMKNLTVEHSNLTPSELKVANLVRQGHSSKEIAQLLSLSSRTVESHRKSIRQKLGIQRHKSNLSSFLQNMCNGLPIRDQH